MFHAPVSLCSAVKMEAEEWLKKGLDYFADPDQELELVTAALRELQAKRYICTHKGTLYHSLTTP